ncbi:hypothetical protein PT974_10792 [Cladobotryum mycophilum]|uniref:Uncharacterized protein n=1 Tax=Cladobotryum mycophilum TaxID=491253 RepID=A0ABR0SBT2_9HYPO
MSIPTPTAKRIGTSNADAELHVTITIDGQEHKFSGSGAYAKLGRINLAKDFLGYKTIQVSFSFERAGSVKPSIDLDIIEPIAFNTKRTALLSAENGVQEGDEDEDDYDDCEVRFLASVSRPVDRSDA